MLPAPSFTTDEHFWKSDWRSLTENRTWELQRDPIHLGQPAEEMPQMPEKGQESRHSGQAETAFYSSPTPQHTTGKRVVPGQQNQRTQGMDLFPVNGTQDCCIICLTETWLSVEIPNEAIEPADRTKDLSRKSKVAGVCFMYTSSSLSAPGISNHLMQTAVAAKRNFWGHCHRCVNPTTG